MKCLRLAPLLALMTVPAMAQVTATHWTANCWTQSGGVGVRWCQAAVEFSVSQGRERFRGSIRLLRSEHGETSAVIAGDRDIDSGSLQVDGGAPRACPDDFDCKLGQAEADAVLADLRAGQLLILRFRPKRMQPVAFSLGLDGYRAALQPSDLMRTDGW